MGTGGADDARTWFSNLIRAVTHSTSKFLQPLCQVTMNKLQKISYEDLNSRQKENYNFQKVAAQLADYGFNCLRLTDDWQGADFIACHIDGNSYLKVQLKGRLNIDQKYAGKGIHIVFCEDGQWYLYPHDEVRDALLVEGAIANSKSWTQRGGYSWPGLSGKIKALMQRYAI